jgi:drug/metabolite transporter (DMT)-like permease
MQGSNNAVNGWVNGFLGVLIFSGSLPATRVAVMDFDPLFLTVARASIAGILALALVGFLKGARPHKSHLLALGLVSFGVVIGFPLLTALALRHLTSAQSIIFLGLLPLATALFGVLRANEKPRPLFWLFSLAGSLLVAGYALSQRIDVSSVGGLYMLAAVLVCGLGYAEGARLTRTLGGWQTISWALILALPLMLTLTFVTRPVSFSHISTSAWCALGYVALFSMLIGFIFWYRGLAQGGIASVGQLQLLQPFLGLAISATLLGEPVSFTMLAVTLAILLCVAGSRRFAR